MDKSNIVFKESPRMQPAKRNMRDSARPLPIPISISRRLDTAPKRDERPAQASVEILPRILLVLSLDIWFLIQHSLFEIEIVIIISW